MTAVAPTSSTSLPAAWTERLFVRLLAIYGARFTDMWRGASSETMKAVWGEALAQCTAAEISRGLEACLTHSWPPTLPEFLKMCRPAMDPERAFLEAVEQMPRRAEGRDKWSSPAVYWAAAKVGNDIMSHGYKAIQARWEKALSEAQEGIRRGDIPAEIPVRLEALPAPGQGSVPAEEARKRIAEIRAAMAAKLRVTPLEKDKS